ncbi:hypothetical protein Nepgr_011338 [Nepenthes gracilis]|uniref:EF-hand domain-containing protein n=1 Tax=Nepenthes gracilis TaxID=150966 RepID=A0AAD3SF49_NEPGR|nr:hypothetical protein Nepgr_011338 [Nepenthes gracilis]
MERDQCEKQMAAMKEAFMLFDTDGDGRIAPSDMGVIMRTLGANPTQAQLRNMEVQEDLRSPLGLARFLDLMFKYMKPEDSAEAELRDAFRVIDKEST